MRVEVNGVGLNVEQRGEGPALLLLHGFTGSSATWQRFQDEWSGYRTIAVDVIGHGESESPADPARYRIDACIEDLTALLDALGVERTALLGYSMGGRIALRFALQRPERLWALVLESASPGIAAAEERRARVESDETLARRLETEGIEAFVDYWQSIPLWASQARLPAETRAALRQQRLHNSALGLANSLRGMGAGADEDVFPRLGELSMPVLLLAGALDERYAALGHDMQAAIAGSKLQIIEDAGHAAHLEQPRAFSDAVVAFLARHAPVTSRVSRP